MARLEKETSMTASHSRATAQDVIELISTVFETYQILKTETDLSDHNTCVRNALLKFEAAIVKASQSFSEAQTQAVLQAPAIQAIQKDLHRLLSQSEFEVEMRFARSLMLEGYDIKTFSYSEHYDNMLGAEIAQIDPSRTGDLVFVGSGPYPISAIMLQEKTKRPVICLDNNPQAVENAARLIESIGLADEILFQQTPGQEYDYRQAAFVIIASLVKEKTCVLSQILATTDRIPRIVLRTTVGLKTLMYEPVDEQSLPEFGLSIAQRIQPHDTVINTALVCVDPRDVRAFQAVPAIPPRRAKTHETPAFY